MFNRVARRVKLLLNLSLANLWYKESVDRAMLSEVSNPTLRVPLLAFNSSFTPELGVLAQVVIVSEDAKSMLGTLSVLCPSALSSLRRRR